MSGDQPIPLPGRECRCQGDGRTWADTTACPVHDSTSSPLAQQVHAAWEEGRAAAREWYIEQLEAALRTIRGPEDRGPWIEIYREAGGGYGGLQAIARAALELRAEA